MLSTRPYNPSDKSAWDAYVLKHPDGTFFHLSAWKEVIEKTFGHTAHYLICENTRESRITGIFPLFSIKSRFFGCPLVSIPFAPYGGILADDGSTKQALFENAVSLTQNTECDYLEIRQEHQSFENLPVKDLYFVFKKEISSKDDDNLQAIPRKARRMIRQGIKNDLKPFFGGPDLLDPFYTLFATSYRNLGTPVFPKAYIRNLLDAFGEQSAILLISKNGTPLSTVLSFYFKDQVIPFYSGAGPESRNFAANDFLYWALMADAAQKGYRLFDFGRSKKDTGPYHFKRHWGFEPKPLPYQYYLNTLKEIPNISPTNPKYRVQIALWKRLPLWTTNLLGPKIIKYIP